MGPRGSGANLLVVAFGTYGITQRTAVQVPLELVSPTTYTVPSFPAAIERLVLSEPPEAGSKGVYPVDSLHNIAV